MKNTSLKFILACVCSCLFLACSEAQQLQPTSTPIIEENPVIIPTETLPASVSNTADCGSDEIYCVGFVSNVSNVNQGSSSQRVWEGVQRAQFDLAAQVELLESESTSDYSSNIQKFAEENYDTIVTLGFDMRIATISSAISHPTIDFIAVDQPQADPIQNIAGIVFPVEKSGFLSGVLAASVTQTNKVGIVLGSDNDPATSDFENGFISGVLAIDSDIEVFVKKHPGSIAEGQTDKRWGEESAKDLITTQNVDVIVAIAGETGNAALVQAANEEGTFCIGVGSDSWNTLPESHRCLVSSVIQQTSTDVFILVAFSAINDFPNGNYLGVVGLSSFNEFDKFFPAQVKEFFRDVENKLQNNLIPFDGTYRFNDPPPVFIQQ